MRIGDNDVNSQESRYSMNKKVIMDAAEAMPAPTLHLPGLLTFEAAARHLNFARAAAELGVTPTAVSRTIKNVEAQLHVRLFNRTTRSVSLTEAGAALNASLAPALVLIRNSLSQALLATDQPSGTLRISASYVAWHILVEPHLAAFLAQYPLINVEISLDNQLTDIVGAGFDLGIRMGRKLQNDMISVQLGAVQKRIVVAAPAYLRQRGEPQTLAGLLKHDCLRQRYSVGGRLYDWKFDDHGQTVQIDVQGRLMFDEMRSVLDAAIQGQGIAFILEAFARQALDSGMLRHILAPHGALDDAFHLYYPHRQHMPGKLRAFVDFMRAANSLKMVRP